IGNNISKVDGPDNWRSTVTDLGAAKNIYDGIKNGKEAIGLINAGKMPIKGGIYATAEVDIDTSKLKGITQSASNLTAGNNINLDLDKVDIVGSNLRANNELSGRIGELNIISKPDTQGSSHSHGHANIDISLYGTPGVNFGLYGEEGGSSFSGVTNQASATGSKVNLRVGHTNLEGGLLASTDENGKDLGQLHLETDTLTYSNVEYKNENQTIGTGITTDGENHNQDSHRIKLEDGITKGETLATIGQGELIVNDGTDTSDLNRDVENTLVISKDEQASVDVTVTKEELQKVAEITKEVVKEVAEIAKDAASTITNVINGSMPAANEYQANMYEAAAMASKEYNLNAEDREKAAVVANAVLSGEISLADFDMKCLSQAQNWSIMDLFVARAYAMCAAGAVVLVPGVGEVVLGAAAVAGVVYIVDKVASKVAEQVKSGGDKAGVTGSPMPDPNDNHDSDHDDRDRSKNKGKENIQFRNEEKLDSHYNKHKNEWNNLSKDEYINKIYNLKNKLPDETNILEFKRDNGDIMKYDVRNNEFLVVDKNGYTKTLFRPEKGVDYWKQEILKWK
ncbi:MAG: hypothetical protein ACXVHW_08370, partial [Methanobacterium sp.]